MEKHDRTRSELPVPPALAEVMAALNEAGHWAIAFDNEWRLVAISDEMAASTRGEVIVSGLRRFGPEEFDRTLQGSSGANRIEENLTIVRTMGGWMLADTPGGRDALRESLHPVFRSLVDDLVPSDAAAAVYEVPTQAFGGSVGAVSVALRIRDATGRVVGTVTVGKPAVGMRTIGLLTASGDVHHLERMQQVAAAGRRPAAVLFVDLEGSTQLAKRLPTATYFTLVRRLTRAADQCIVDAGGLVGRHVGDGFTAFFVAETAASESAAARGCITAARALQAATVDIAARHDLAPADLTLRAGLHWGAKLYIGSVVTAGRTEVTALGDEVNEAARIEACATRGRALASKDLIERLDPDDASALGIDPSGITYTQLTDLDTATDKARRDAPTIPVHDIAILTT